MNSLELRGQWGYSRTSKSGWIRLQATGSWETKAIQKIRSRNSTLSSHIKLYLQLFITIICKKYLYYWNITLNYCFICKNNIRGNFIRKCSWFCYIPLYLWAYCFPFFLHNILIFLIPWVNDTPSISKLLNWAGI